MKMTKKTLTILAALAVFGTTGLFAQEQNVQTDDVISIERKIPEYENAQTFAVSVKVSEKKGVKTIYLKVRDGKTYIADAINEDANKAIELLATRNGKKAVVSGVLNPKTGVLKVIKMGGLVPSNSTDEK